MISFSLNPKWGKTTNIVLFDKTTIKNKKIDSANTTINKALASVIKAGQFTAESGQSFPLFVDDQLILLVGLGDKKEYSLTSVRVQIKKALESSFLNKIKTINIIPHNSDDEAIQAIIEGAIIGNYRWKKYHTKAKNDKNIDKKNIVIIANKKPLYHETIIISEAANLTRDLINENADIATSTFIEKEIRSIIKGKKNIKIDVLNEKELKAKKMNLHLAVNRGSNKEPKLIIVKYTGADKSKPYTAFLGKGITFDTGGLNLKPSGYIETMRCDMSGTAAVVGTLKAISSLKLKKNIIFACALAENAIGSNAYKPGDVFTSYSGKTVEIGNTDAEGRLVLADAISYLKKNYQPAKIIDIATLTGACVVALGNDYTGLMSNNDKLAEKLLESARSTDDRAWQLPLYKEVKRAVKSQIADIKNMGFPKGAAGSITAAEFLHQFAEDTTWAHLDIAGTAFADSPRMYFNQGATGAGVRLMTHYLKNN